MMYESPIKMIVDDMTEKIVREQEDYIVKCVQNIGISVDKAELKRALAYDRQQYDKGFADGYEKAKEDVVRCKDCKHRPTMPEDGKEVQDLEFPDDDCPLQCGDHWYNREPSDDWYCANGERSEER